MKERTIKWAAQGETTSYCEAEFVVPVEEYASVVIDAIGGWLWDLEFGLLQEKREQ